MYNKISPFKASSIHDIFEKIKYGKIYFSSIVPKFAQDLIRSILTLDPLRRPKIG